ncbi:tape measure protein [Corynebacterium sp. ACRPQ]|uniref:tape measure protein n=1 Tax=Corynebacterium sp. ACRPQ TaxID=2918201 RepID=UPI001EF2F198|nr:tape measure protein [Corynebacterium sp. ACRPQ]MCG7440672.1 tape measure protein [Corynebacterium sp. ACRPQ]
MSATGYAVLPTTVSLSGINKELQSQLLAPASKAAKKAGDSIEKGISKGTDNAAAKVEKANYRVKKSSEELADAEAKRNSEVLKSQAAVKQLEAAESKLSEMKKSGKASSEQLAKAEGDVLNKRAKVQTTAQNVEKAERGVEKAMAESKRAAESLEQRTRELEQAQDSASNSTNEFGDALDSAESKSSGFFGTLGRSIGKIGGVAAAFAGLSGIAGTVQEGFAKVTSIEDTTASLGILMGSAEEATKVMGELEKSNQRTPYSFDAWAGAGKNLIAFGVEAEKASDIVTALGEAASASGKGEQALNSMADSFGKAAASGKISMDTINSLAEGGVQGLTILANEYGVTTEEMQKKISSGAVDAAEGIDILTKGILEGSSGMAGEVESMSGVMGKMAETTSGRLTNMKAAFNNAAKAGLEEISPLIGDIALKITDFTYVAIDVFKDQLVPAIKAVVDALKSVGEWISRNSDWLSSLAVSVGTVVGAYKLLVLQQKIMAAGGFVSWAMKAVKATQLWTTVTKAQATAQRILNTVMRANPMGLIITGITAVVAGLTWFFAKTETGQKIWAQFTEALGAGWDWVVEKFQAGLDWVQSTFGPVFSQIGETISGAWDATVEKVTGAVDRVKEIFSGALDFLKTGDTTDYAAALGISEDSPIFTALTFFRDRIVDLKNVAVAAWDFMKSKWEEFTTGFGQFYQTWIAPVVEFIKAGFFALQATAINAWNSMQEKWAEFTQGFGEFYQSWIAPIVDVMMTGFQVLGSVVSAAFSGISTAFQFVGSIISAVWSGAIQPVLALFMSVVQSVASFVVPIFTAVIGGAFRTMGSLISNVWNGVIKPAWDFFRNAAGLLADVLTGNFSNIRNRFSAMGQAISNIVHGVINSAMNFFRSIFENAKQVAASFGQAIGRMVGTVRNKIGEMMGVLGQIPGKVQGVFASAGSWLVNAGKNIINGLINGIKSMFGQVGNAIGSVMPDKIRGMLGFMDGGVYMAEGGITRAYIDGGIDKLERYANGGSKEQHKAQIAKGGEWRVWAEPETGGESYIPLAKSKRKRSTQILAKTADIFGLSVVDKKGELVKPGTSSQVAPSKSQYFANGGITAKEIRSFVEGARVRGYQASRSLEGAPYKWASSDWGDCSASMSSISAFAVGLNPFPRKFATGNEAAWLSSHGFHRGRGKKGDLRIGFKNGGPAGGHTAGTLPDGTNVEMGGARGNGQIGGRAAGAWDSYFDTFFYKTIKPPKPPKMNKILDQNAIPDGASMTIDGVPVSVSADETTGSTGENTVTVALSPEDAAKATAAKELGDQSILDFAVDGIFDMLGMKDSTIKKLLTTKGKDLLPSGESIVTTQQVKEQPRTSVAAKNAQAIESDAATSLSPAKMAKDPQLAAPKPEKKKGPTWGPDFFAGEIARKAKDMRLDKLAAKIGLATALVESGNPLKMWANRAVPESLKYRHDAVGSDYDSVGLFQQRDNGAWGTVKQRMTPYDSAGMFFDKLKGFDYHAMDPGAAAQKVQVSAFPDRYGQQMGNAEKLLNKVGVFDQGGWLKPGGIAVNLSNEPEPVFNGDQWRDIKRGGLKSDDGMTLVVNLEGQEVLRKRMDKVEGEVTINTEEIGKLRRRTGVAVAATTRGGAM